MAVSREIAYVIGTVVVGGVVVVVGGRVVVVGVSVVVVGVSVVVVGGSVVEEAATSEESPPLHPARPAAKAIDNNLAATHFLCHFMGACLRRLRELVNLIGAVFREPSDGQDAERHSVSSKYPDASLFQLEEIREETAWRRRFCTRTEFGDDVINDPRFCNQIIAGENPHIEVPE